MSASPPWLLTWVVAAVAMLLALATAFAAALLSSILTGIAASNAGPNSIPREHAIPFAIVVGTGFGAIVTAVALIPATLWFFSAATVGPWLFRHRDVSLMWGALYGLALAAPALIAVGLLRPFHIMSPHAEPVDFRPWLLPATAAGGAFGGMLLALVLRRPA